MKFAVITDIHIGKYQKHGLIYRKNTRYSKKSLRRFVRKMNKDYKPDFVVNCGDMVEDIDVKHDKKNFAAGVKILSRLKCPVYHVIGNHDQRNLSDTFLESTIGKSNLFYKVDTDDHRLIFLVTRQPFKPDGTLYEPHLDDQQLEWLRHTVDTDRKLIIFSHASPIPVDTTGNFWFESDAHSAYIKNYKDFLSIIKGKNVIASFNGHLHWNKLVEFDGVHYVTVQSLVENTSGRVKGSPANAYALVDVGVDKVSVDIRGWGGTKYEFDSTHGAKSGY